MIAPVPAAGRSGRGRLAQWLEHAVHIRGVTGSNPVSPTTLTATERGLIAGPVSAWSERTLAPAGAMDGGARCRQDPTGIGEYG